MLVHVKLVLQFYMNAHVLIQLSTLLATRLELNKLL